MTSSNSFNAHPLQRVGILFPDGVIRQLHRASWACGTLCTFLSVNRADQQGIILLMQKASTRPLNDRDALKALGSFLAPAGTLPGFAQRRLDQLIHRQKTAGLEQSEQRELKEMLSYIDRKSLELLKFRAARSSTHSAR